MARPIGKVSLVRFVEEDGGTIVARGLVVVKDEQGTLFSYPAASFLSELQPYHENQPSFHTWQRQLSDLRMKAYSYWTLSREVEERYYRDGLSPEAALERSEKERYT